MNEVSEGDSGSSAMQDIVKEFFDAKKNVWNEKNDIKIKGFDWVIWLLKNDHFRIVG